MALLLLEKLRKDINILFGYVKCLMAKSDENSPLVATEWSSNHSTSTGNPYTAGTYVFWNGNVYKCLIENNGFPPNNTTYWLKLGEGHLLAEEQSNWNSTGGRNFILNKPTKTSDFINDGENGSSPYVTENELSNALPSLPPSLNYGLYSQILKSPPITGLAPQSLIAAGEGSLSVPANAFQRGDSFHLKMAGRISSGNNNVLIIQLTSNNVVLASTGNITLPSTSQKNWELTTDFTVRSTGTPGLAILQTGGKFLYNKDASNAFEGVTFSYTENINFNTTIANTLEITATWLTSNANNSIFSEQLILNKIY